MSAGAGISTTTHSFASLLQLVRPTKVANGAWYKPKLSGRRLAELRKQAILANNASWDEAAMRAAMVRSLFRTNATTL